MFGKLPSQLGLRRFRLLLALPLLALAGGSSVTGCGAGSTGPHCSKGCPCGASCISCSKTCHKEADYAITGIVPDSLEPK